MGVMLSEDEDIRPITWETRDEYVDRMLLREICCVGGVWCALGNLVGSPPDKFKEYYRHAYDEYHVWGHELVEGAFTIALLAAVKDMGGVWWRPDLFERNWSGDDDDDDDDDDKRDDVVLPPACTIAIERSIEEFEAALACPVARPQLLAKLKGCRAGEAGVLCTCALFDYPHSSNC